MFSQIHLTTNLIILLLILLLIRCNQAQFKRANRKWLFESCDQDNLEECSQRLYLFGYRAINDTNSVMNINQMKDYCFETREAEKCTKVWGKNCLPTFQRQCLNLLVSGAAKSRRSLCNAKGQQRFLQNRECFIRTVNEQHDCMDQFKDNISKLVTIQKSKFILKLQCSCCFADKWLKCFRASAEKVCDETGLKFLEWVVNPYMSDALELGCRKEWTYGSDSCSKSIEKLPELLGTQHNISKSIMFPLYSILSEFSELQDN